MGVKEPGHFEVRKSSSRVTRSQGRSQDFTLGPQKLSAEGHRRSQDFLWGAIFSFKKLTTFLGVALETQAANAADCFTVKIKQIKRLDMVTFFVIFCAHYYRSKAISRVGPGWWIFQPGHLTWRALV